MCVAAHLAATPLLPSAVASDRARRRRHASCTVTERRLQILACDATAESIMPFIKAFKEMVRRRPFLVQRLEEVLKKLLTSCEFFDDDGRKKIAISAPPASAFLALPPTPPP